MTRGEWIKRFKDYMRPYVNDAPTEGDLEEFLDITSNNAFISVADYHNTTPEDAAMNAVDALGYGNHPNP